MKLNKLLPIVALSGIATVATPLITSCNSGGSQSEDEIITGSYEWESGESQTAKPFEYPSWYEALPAGTEVSYVNLWENYTSIDRCGDYLACDFINSVSNMEYSKNFKYEASVELNVTSQRLTALIKTNSTGHIKFTNVPVSMGIYTDVEPGDPFKYYLAPIGAYNESLDIFSFNNWEVEWKTGDQIIKFGSESDVEDIEDDWGDWAGYLLCYLHYFDNISIK